MAWNPDRADDLVQETLAKAWAHQSKFKDATTLRAWLSTILRNTYCTPFFAGSGLASMICAFGAQRH
jgi:DNA-directed RNA polymerase specialized sigma24 family protein